MLCRRVFVAILTTVLLCAPVGFSELPASIAADECQGSGSSTSQSELLACFGALAAQVRQPFDGCGTRLQACRVMTDSRMAAAVKVALRLTTFPPVPQSSIDLVHTGMGMVHHVQTIEDFIRMYTTFENALIAAPWYVEGWKQYSIAFESVGAFPDALDAMKFAAMFQRSGDQGPRPGGMFAPVSVDQGAQIRARIAYLQARIAQIEAQYPARVAATPEPPPLPSAPPPSTLPAPDTSRTRSNSPPGIGEAATVTSPEDAERALAERLIPGAGGIYAAGNATSFNSLDSVFFDPATHQLSLVGHRDEHYRGPRIPYLQLLAELLEAPKPEFTLTGTPDSDARIDQLFNTRLSPAQSDALSERWGEFVDPSGQVSDVGHFMLPALGISPIAGGRAPGYLGISFSPSVVPIVLTAVTPGSPADAAGLRAGDTITAINGSLVVYPEALTKAIRFAGAGGTLTLQCVCSGQVRLVTSTLTANPNSDPWSGTNRYDVMATIYRAAGQQQAANVIAAFGMVNDTQYAYPQLGQTTTDAVFLAAGYYAQADAIRRQFQAGQIPPATAYNEIGIGLANDLERVFSLPSNVLAGAFQAEMQRSGNFPAAIAAIFTQFDISIKPAFGPLLDTLIYRPDGLQIAPELIEREFHVHPEVVPQYLGVPATSQLARLMFDADYLGKRLINQPNLDRDVPGYQTSFAFELHHPQFARTEASYRLWISVAHMSVAQSLSGNTLDFRDVRMRFNMRELGANGRDLPNHPGGYEDLLTTLYEPLSQRYFTLHELKEAAKLAAAARWIHLHDPAFRLPTAGRVAWNGPSRMPGLVYFYLYPDAARHTHMKMIATGGISLTPFPPENVANPFSSDSSVVDLTHSSLIAPASVEEIPAADDVVAPRVPQNTALRRITAHTICVPSPIAPAFIATASRGAETYQSLSVALNALDASPDQIARSNDLRQKLDVARRDAQQLLFAEQTINDLNLKVAAGAIGFAATQRQLVRDRDAFIRDASGTIEEAGDDMISQLSLAEHLNPDASSFLSGLSTSKSLYDLHEFLERISEAHGLSEAAVEKLPDGLTLDFIKTAAEQLGYHGEESVDPTVLRSGATMFEPEGHFNAPGYLEMIGDFKVLQGVWKVEAGFAKLEFLTAKHVDQLEAQSDAARMLQAKLLPVARDLNDRLDADLADPAVRAVVPAPKRAGGCR